MTYQYYPYQAAPNYAIAPQYQVQQPQRLSTSGIIWVNSEQEAQAYPVAPNNAIALWESSGKVVYLKQADATGKPTMRVYDLVERTNEPVQPDEPPEYIPKREYSKVVGAVKQIAEEVKQLKSDMYAEETGGGKHAE